jgi:Asp-tRNA(Asn)/Glu-tRNA(Gln) amidotransferase A subunit family amidase
MTSTPHAASSFWRNPYALSFAEAVADFRSGRQTPRDFLERCIEACQRREPVLRAFVCTDFAAARAAADASTQRYREHRALSPVDGCPVGVKDIMNTADLPTQMGSPAFRGWQAGHDAACVKALRDGGAVILGKTVTTEFAVGFSGPTTNPFDPARTPGGSSSGSAAAVGAGLLPAALGTQTQGSTLRPASYCGAWGFKPTLHALHLGGVHPLSTTADHLGVIAATLEDTWLIASQVSRAVGSPGYGVLQGAGPLPEARLPRRLIRLHTRGWAETDAASRAAFEAAVAALEAKGVAVMGPEDNPRIAAFEAAMEARFDDALDIVAWEMRWPYEGYLARYGDLIGRRIHGLIERARAMRPEDHAALLSRRRELQAQCRALAAELGADAYLMLASSGPAIEGFEFSGSRNYLVYGSWLGFPAFSLPVLSVGELPLGLQLLGLGDRDGELCAVARAVAQCLR